MKNKNLIALVVIFCSIAASAQTKEKDMQDIKNTITAFADAGDSNDTKYLEECLDSNFRIVMNRLFGSTDVTTIDKSAYIAKISSKEWGGDRRTISFESVIVNNTTASAKVLFKGSKSSFTSLITLIKNNSGKWQLVSDVPVFI